MDVKKRSQETEIDTVRLTVKPRLGLFDAVVFMLGQIIGSGIFVSPKGALQHTGSVGACLVTWLVCGGLSALFALVYAELGVMLPRSGGDYTYIKRGLGPIPAFLVSWIQTLVVTNGTRAVLALVFADYICAPFFGKCGPPDIVRKIVAIVKLILLSTTNTISVRLVTLFQWFFTAIKVLALLTISISGVVFLCQGKSDHFDKPFVGTTHDVSSIAIAFYNGLWAYSGYQHLNEIAEEVKFPRKTIPRAAVITMTIVTILYLLANVSYFTLLSKKEFLSSSAVAYDWAKYAFGGTAVLITAGVICSVYGAGNGGTMADSRQRFAASRAGHLPEVLSFLHQQSKIPVAAIWFNTACAMIMLIPGDINVLINIVSFAAYSIVGMSMIASIRLRRIIHRKDSDFQLPVVFPIVSLLICVFMVVAPLINDPKVEFLYGVGIIAAGLIFYFPFVHFKWSIPGFDHVTTFLQLVFDSCPTVEEEKLQN